MNRRVPTCGRLEGSCLSTVDLGAKAEAAPYLKTAARRNERVLRGRALRHWGVSLGAVLCATTALATLARAQSYSSAAAPPLHQVIDSNGVDLVNGILNISGGSVSIGSAGGGLSYQYLGYGSSANADFGAISCSGSTCTVSIGSSSESFTASGSRWVSSEGFGSTLTGSSGSGSFTYTASDGTVAQFTLGTSLTPFVATTSVLSTLTKPSGEVLTYNYLFGSFCGGTGPQNVCEEYVASARPQSISSNRGYQLHFSYVTDSLSTAAFVQLTQVVAINTSVNYCNPAADSCTGLTQTWPTINYSGSGTITVTDAVGRATTHYGQVFNYPSGETLTQASTSNGFTISNGVGTWTYAASTSGTMVTRTVTDPLGHTRTVVSNSSIDQPLSDKDGVGNKTTYQHDSLGRLTQVTYPEGDYTQYQYDNGVSNGRGNVTQTTRVAKSGSGLANIVTYASYDTTCTYAVKCNKPNSTTDALGNVTSYTYSTVHGGVLSVTRPAVNGVSPVTAYSYAQVATYAMNSAGTLSQVGSIWEPTGTATCATSAATVSASNTTTSLSCAAGAGDLVTTSISYAGSYNAQPTSITRGNGSVSATTSIAYDTLGNVVSKTDPLGNQTALFYDADRELTGVIGPDPDGSGPLQNRAVRLTYDGGGRVSLAERGTTAGQTASAFSNFSSLSQLATTYNAINQKLSDAAEANGSTYALTQYAYDNAGRLQCAVSRMNASAFSSEPGACSLGTQGNYGPDRISYITYDNANKPLMLTTGYGTSSARNEAVRSYGADGETTNQVDAKGNLTTYNVDGFNRPYQIFLPNPSNGGVSSSSDYEQYTYDANSNLTQDRRRDGQTIGYSYDALNRPTTTANGGTLAYDNLGRITSASRGGQTNTFTYDALSRKLSESQPLGTMSSGYDADGDRTSLTYPDGYAVTYGYDATGALSSVSDGSGSIANYTYDNLGRLTGLTRNGGPTTSLSYSTSDLTLYTLSHSFSDTTKNVTFGYASSPAGQLITVTSSNTLYNYTVPTSVTKSFTVDGQNKYTAVGGASLTSDARGNLTNDGATGLTYAYDDANELISTSAGASLSYDGLGRLSKTAAGSAATQFLYDGDQIVGEYNASGAMADRYVPGAGVDRPLLGFQGASTAAARRVWSITNHQGSFIALANATTAVAINTYDEAGNPGSSNLGRFQFDGMPYILDTGLYHDRARDYDSNIGRFTQTDPIGYGDGMNWYAYTHNDPVNGVDPSGLQTAPAGPPTVPQGTCDSVGTCVASGTSGEIVVTALGNSPPCPDGASCVSNIDLSDLGGSEFGAPPQPLPDPYAAGQKALQLAAQQLQLIGFKNSNNCAARATPPLPGGAQSAINLGQLNAVAAQKFLQHSFPINPATGRSQSVFGGIVTGPGILSALTVELISTYSNVPAGGGNARITGDTGQNVGTDQFGDDTSYLTLILGPPVGEDANGLPLRPAISLYPGC